MPKGVFLRTKEHKEHIKNALKGKTKSEAHRKHLRDAHKEGKYTKANEKHSSFMKGENNPMFGKEKSENQKQWLVEYNKNRIVSKEEREVRRQNALNNPNRKFKDTSIELKIEEELKIRSIHYEKQVPLCKIAIVDFYLPKQRIVIQCDGCYWHGCPIHQRSTIKNIEERRERDKNKDSILTFNGFNVYRFWEHEINQSVEDCINKLILK